MSYFERARIGDYIEPCVRIVEIYPEGYTTSFDERADEIANVAKGAKRHYDVHTLEDFVRRDGHAGRAIYLSLIARATLTRHNHTPVMEVFRNGSWATYRDLSREEVVKWLGEGYLRNMRGAK